MENKELAIYNIKLTGMPYNSKNIEVEAKSKEDALLKALLKEFGIRKIEIICLR